MCSTTCFESVSSPVFNNKKAEKTVNMKNIKCVIFIPLSTRMNRRKKITTKLNSREPVDPDRIEKNVVKKNITINKDHHLFLFVIRAIE
jgi:hypothetical protein